jgi:hypothetical protein
MFGRRRAASASGTASDTASGTAPTAAQLTADEQAVRVAEAVVGQAWAVELIRRHDMAVDDLHAGEKLFATARQRLDAARGNGDPRRISLARAHLERASSIFHESEVACEQIRSAVHAELRLLARATGQRALTELVQRWEAETPAPPVQSPDPRTAPDVPAPNEAPWSLWRRILGRTLGLFAGRITVLQQP